MQASQKQIVIALAVASITLGALGAWRVALTTPQSTEQASYVRICRDARGQLDRRACRLNDPKRTQLALNLDESSAP